MVSLQRGFRPSPGSLLLQHAAPQAPGSDAQTHPREGHRSHCLAISSAFWLSPPLLGEGAAAAAAVAAAVEAAELSRFSRGMEGRGGEPHVYGQ